MEDEHALLEKSKNLDRKYFDFYLNYWGKIFHL